MVVHEFKRVGWGFGDPVSLSFARDDNIPEGHVAVIPAGMLSSDSSDLGATLTSDENYALSIKFPKYPVSDSEISGIIQEALVWMAADRARGRLLSENLTGYVEMLQANSLTKQVQAIQETYFQNGLEAPTIEIVWDDDLTEDLLTGYAYRRVASVEAIVSGVSNGHPHWDGQEVAL